MNYRNKIFLSFSLIIVISSSLLVVNFVFLNRLRILSSETVPLSEFTRSLQEEVNTYQSLETQLDNYVIVGSTQEKKHLMRDLEVTTAKTEKWLSERKMVMEHKSALSALIVKLTNDLNELIAVKETGTDKYQINTNIIETYGTIDAIVEMEKKYLDEQSVVMAKNIDTQKNIIAQIIGFLFVVESLIVAVGLFSAVVISRQLMAGLSKLGKTSKDITSGNLHVRADITSKDEVGELASTFNQMTSQLQESYQGLEQKIGERTKALSQQKEELERMNKLMIDRELKMIELKKENEALRQKGGG